MNLSRTGARDFEQSLLQWVEVANPSSQDRTPRRAILLAVPSAAAPYRASGLVLWPIATNSQASLGSPFEGRADVIADY